MKFLCSILFCVSIIAYPQNNIFIDNYGSLHIYDLEKKIIKEVIVEDCFIYSGFRVVDDKIFVTSMMLKDTGDCKVSNKMVLGMGNWREDSAIIKINNLFCGQVYLVSPDQKKIIYNCPNYDISQKNGEREFIYDIPKNLSLELINYNILGWFDNENLFIENDSVISLLNINNNNLTEFINKNDKGIINDLLKNNGKGAEEIELLSMRIIDENKILVIYFSLPYHYYIGLVDLSTLEVNGLPLNLSSEFRIWDKKIFGIFKEHDEKEQSYLWITDENGKIIEKKNMKEIFQIPEEVNGNRFILSRSMQNNRIVINYSNFDAPNNKEGYYFLNLNDYTLERIPFINEKPNAQTIIDTH